ncbi:putative syntaxin 5 [Cardiosporidium cionae]|uniref:Syntaxin 5 n=1 Tax=Cardiosporidium cionae TaxID=476202 RepID=A0ABQ7JG04_9APIC|nr:putative syntaxin 5 [Cardiosporidium cionae]|eukprot:KAF8822913.1 putative syntaxin 5 [Cardiosporidium cionae]
MQCFDRTSDFQKAAQRIGGTLGNTSSCILPQTVSNGSVVHKNESLYASSTTGLRLRPRESSSSPADRNFHALSKEFDGSLQSAMDHLQKMRKLVKHRGIFRDSTREVEELTYEINQAVTSLTAKFQKMEDMARTVDTANSHNRSHYVAIVNGQKSRFLELTQNFKNLLQAHSDNMRKQDDRRNLYSYSSAYQNSENTHIFTSQPHDAAEIDLESGQKHMQQERHRGFSYAHSRKEAMENIQRAISELANVFQRVASMVSQQEEMILRIDEDVDYSLHNVREGALCPLSLGCIFCSVFDLKMKK